MTGVLDGLHVAMAASSVTCGTDANGQPVCTSVPAGAWAGLGIFLFIYLAIFVVMIVAYVKIISKAGYSGWWVLIGIVPFVNIVFFLVFAFSEWPVLKEVRLLRQQAAGGSPYGRPGGYGTAAGGGPSPYAAAPIPAGPWGGGPSGPEPQADQPDHLAHPGQPGHLTPTGPTESDMAQTAIPSFGQVIRGDAPDPTAPVVASDGPPVAPEVSAPAAGAGPPAGWFPAPGGPEGRQRYWDGTAWTEHYL